MGKRNKKFYAVTSKRQKYGEDRQLNPGAKGYLLTFVRGRDRQAKSEAFELLSSYISVPTDATHNSEDSDRSDYADSCEDVEAAMKREVANLKKKRPTKVVNFQDPGVNHTLFVKCATEVPAQVTYDILDDALSGNLKVPTKTLLRFLPVQLTCRAELDAITKSLIECIDGCVKHHYNTPEHQPNASPKFAYKVDFKRKYNDDKSLVKAEVYERVGLIMSEKYPAASVRLNDPDLIVILDIMKKVCCISIVKDFSKYKKFNLQELSVNFHVGKSKRSDQTLRVNVTKEICQTSHEETKTVDSGAPTNETVEIDGEANGNTAAAVLSDPKSAVSQVDAQL